MFLLLTDPAPLSPSRVLFYIYLYIYINYLLSLFLESLFSVLSLLLYQYSSC